jgi:hypothetical protein
LSPGDFTIFYAFDTPNQPVTNFHSVNMQFTTIVAAVLSMAALAFAAPVGTSRCFEVLCDQRLTYESEVARQNHGMCVKGTAAGVEQIDC